MRILNESLNHRLWKHRKKAFLALKNLNHEVSLLSLSAKKEEFKNTPIYRSLKECDLNEFDLFIIANITTEHFNILKTLDELVKDKTILVEKPLFEKAKFHKLKKSHLCSVFTAFSSCDCSFKKTFKR